VPYDVLLNSTQASSENTLVLFWYSAVTLESKNKCLLVYIALPSFKKVKLPHACHKSIQGEQGIATLILKPNSRWRVVGFMIQLLCPWGKNPPVPIEWEVVWVWMFGKYKKFLPVRFLVFLSVLSNGAIKLNVLCCINALFYPL